MLWRLSRRFQFAADRIIPDSFVFCIILSLLVFILGLLLTPSGPLKMVISWYNGLWDMIAFAFQMSFMVICCGAAAKSPQIERFLKRVSEIPRSAAVAMVILLVFGFISSLINWAFSAILTPIFAMQLSRKVKGLHFPVMIAAGYSTMCLGQCFCPSASVFALVATKGHFLEQSIGILTQDYTVFNPVNTALWFILVFATIIIGVMIRPPENEIVMYQGSDEPAAAVAQAVTEEKQTLAEKMNSSSILMYIVGLAGLVAIIYNFATKGFIGSLNFNFVIFLFLTINCFLYNTPQKFVGAIRDSMKPATDVMLQFPFYGGIMGMMSGSGLAQVMVDALVQIATPVTLPVWSYLSACLVNVFIPSQGGQWIVQGPILVEAAKTLNVDLNLIINAFVYGDETTNLINPLYVIPALSLVGMKLKEVWGFMAFICVFWMVIASVGFLVLPGLF